MSLRAPGELLAKNAPLKREKPTLEGFKPLWEPSPRRVRLFYGSTLICDTTSAILLWEVPYYPQYYLPIADIRGVEFEEKSKLPEGPGCTGSLNDVVVKGSETKVSGLARPEALRIQYGKEIVDHVRFEFSRFRWFEEDDPISIHPMDPYKRIDCRRSSREVRVEIDGVEVAKSAWSVHLYETGLPVRYYLPRSAIEWKYFTQTNRISGCPYKGTAGYWDGKINGKTHEGAIWGYDTCLPAVVEIQNLVTFYNERVDVWLDGKKMERPKSKFG